MRLRRSPTRKVHLGELSVLKVATKIDPRATILSVDAAGAYDHVSRGAMLEALHARPELQPLLPSARQFYATPSSCTWVDASGTSHTVTQGEGGEQGDPLMPGLYSLVAHPALHAVHAGLRDGEAVFAFLGDVYIVASPERVRELYAADARAARPCQDAYLERSRRGTC